ncbi:MAG: hypothetical protein E7158_05890 [Firmicutes bacterium]|nr:hypothetical protein [Bacillota bacterium]
MKKIKYVMFAAFLLLININVYAANDVLCVRATSLNENAKGEKYGNLGSGDTLNPGDAFDCDVKGDGSFNGTDGKKARFYYVTTSGNKAILLSYKLGSPTNYYGAYNNTPTVDSWPNIATIDVNRVVKNEDGNPFNGDSSTVSLQYESVARLLTYQELKAACPNASSSSKSLEGCKWLLEGTKYDDENPNTSTKPNGYWLETAKTGTTNNFWIVYASVSNDAETLATLPKLQPLAEENSSVGFKVVIEVDLSKISTATNNNNNNNNNNNENNNGGHNTGHDNSGHNTGHNNTGHNDNNNSNTGDTSDKLPANTKISNLKVGDYIYLTPSNNKYTISKSDSGCDSDQTINPQKLNVWRVIKKNSDGTIELISEYTQGQSATKGICLKGMTGYKNAVGVLENIAATYAKTDFTTKTRYMGYNGQTKKITDTSKISVAEPGMCTFNSSDNLCNTRNNDYEQYGGGDMLHSTDVSLVRTSLGDLMANNVDNIEKTSPYWLASRVYTYSNNSYWFLRVRAVNQSGELNNDAGLFAYDGGRKVEKAFDLNVRPIITINSELFLKDGKGTKEEPYGIGLSGTDDKSTTKEAKEVIKNTKSGDVNNVNSSSGDNSNNGDGSSDSSKKEVENPTTGAFISVALIAILGTAAFFINKYVKKKKLLVKI